MKKIRIFAVLIAAVMLFTGIPEVWESPLAVSAEAYTLDAPKSFIASDSTANTITLSWSKVKGASKYRLYKYDKKTDEYEKFKDVSDTKYVVKNLSPDTTYKFKVAALLYKNGKYTAQKKSVKLNARTKKKANTASFNAPGNLKAESRETSVKLTWTAAYGAGAYRIYLYNSGTKRYETLESVIALSYTATGLTPGTKYKFKVASLSYKGGSYSVLATSDPITAKTTSVYSGTASGKSYDTDELFYPKAGATKSSFLKNYGITNYTKSTDATDKTNEKLYGMTTYVGDMRLNGYSAVIYFSFNNKDRLCSFEIYAYMSYSDYQSIVNLALDDFGKNYSRYTVSSTTGYEWKKTGATVTMHFNSSRKYLAYKVVYTDYMP